MSNAVPTCETVQVVLFRGDRSGPFAARIKRELDDQKNNKLGVKPSALDCLLLAGHTGVSTDGETTIYGFNPDTTGILLWQLMEGLKNGDSFPGIVTDDTAVFAAARTHGLAVVLFKVVLPDPRFQEFQSRLDAERKGSQYTYGYPNGYGDCNCTTWLERLGLPLFSGRMDEFSGLRGISIYPSRRFGKCV
jgi:hypothetical protein